MELQPDAATEVCTRQDCTFCSTLQRVNRLAFSTALAKHKQRMAQQWHMHNTGTLTLLALLICQGAASLSTHESELTNTCTTLAPTRTTLPTTWQAFVTTIVQLSRLQQAALTDRPATSAHKINRAHAGKPQQPNRHCPADNRLCDFLYLHKYIPLAQLGMQLLQQACAQNSCACIPVDTHFVAEERDQSQQKHGAPTWIYITLPR